MAKYNLTTLDELNDEIWGPIGTPERDAMEAQLKEDLNAYFVGEAIKKARVSRNLTQEELGEMLGVQKSQISRMERGRNMSLSTLRRVFSTLGFKSGSLDLGDGIKVALW